MRITRRSAPAVAALALVIAACGGDDGNGGALDPETGGGPTEAGTPDSGETDGADGTGEADESGGADGAPGDGATGEPSTLLAAELHPIELPEPGTAVVRLAGETYVFEALDICRIAETAPGRFSFVAIGNGEIADGSQTRFDVSRYLVDPEVWTPGDWHERDYVQMTVEQEPGGGMFSNAWHDTTRDEPGGPVTGDSDVMPVVRVVDDGGVVAATAIAEVSHPPFTGDFDRTGEGLAEFAVVCG